MNGLLTKTEMMERIDYLLDLLEDPDFAYTRNRYRINEEIMDLEREMARF